MQQRTCNGCEKTFNYRPHGGYKLNECATCISKRRRYENKERAVKLKGGQCQICGYKRCNRALSFHHVDSALKERTISKGLNASWKQIEKELEKCILLCTNCHMEIHDGIMILPQTGSPSPEL